MSKITISQTNGILRGLVSLPSSKSESNRALILRALSGNRIQVENLSEARDTKLLQAALASDATEINVLDAGTAMRFLTAYYCASGQHKILTGSGRMCERPIGILVDALRDIGYDISYVDKEGFPPLEIIPVDQSKLKNEVLIAGNISSQYISALMMIAPVLEGGLTIHFTTSLSSRPYLALTAKLMQEAELHCEISEERIEIKHQPFGQAAIKIGADWSAASYWFSIVALARDAAVHLMRLSLETSQGDAKIAEWAPLFGVGVEETYGALILRTAPLERRADLHFDFTDYPDLAQTVIVICAAKNIKATFSGLQSLRIKETDRILAIQQELAKFSVLLEETKDDVFQLNGQFTHRPFETIKTYNDHRMAMAFAPLALLGDIAIENPEVVDKSYPTFWDELSNVGFDIEV